MRCRKVRKAIVLKKHGWLSPAVESAMIIHMVRCPACAAEKRSEDELIRALGLLHVEAPFEIDVAERVVSRILAIESVRRQEVTPRELGWGALAASGMALALLVTAANVLSEVPDLLARAKAAASGMGGLLGDAARPFFTAAGVAWTFTRVLGGAFASTVTLLEKAEPLARAAALLAVLVMTSVTGMIVGRDLLPRASESRRKEP